jgi:hypothetical protein
VKKRILIGGLVITVLAIGLVAAVVYYNLGFRQSAEVTPVAIVKVFTNAEQTDELTQGEMIAWGEVHAGEQTKSLWINNTGPAGAVLQFNVDQQQLQQWGWTETWTYDNTPLEQNELRPVTITLELPADIGAGHYEWNAGITAYIP